MQLQKASGTLKPTNNSSWLPSPRWLSSFCFVVGLSQSLIFNFAYAFTSPETKTAKQSGRGAGGEGQILRIKFGLATNFVLSESCLN